MNTIHQIQPQYNNNEYQVPFKSLKWIQWKGNFNPLDNLNDAEIYHAFKKSEPIKEFFKKYDGIVEFYRGVFKSTMNIKYTMEKPEKNWWKRQVQNIKNFVLDYASETPYEKYTIEVPLLNKNSLDNIGQDLEQGIKKSEEARQRKAYEQELINKLLNE